MCVGGGGGGLEVGELGGGVSRYKLDIVGLNVCFFELPWDDHILTFNHLVTSSTYSGGQLFVGA